MSRSLRILLALVFVLSCLLVPVSSAQQPVVHGVFFFSPSCPHCHEVMTNFWPQVEAQFGNQLHVLFVDITQPEGNQIMSDARATLRIAETGVPMLIIGREVLVGSIDIPAHTAEIVQAGLDAGGIPLPRISGIEQVYQRAVADAAAVQAGSLQPQSAATLGVVAPVSLFERLINDPIANTLALVVLGLLLFSLGALVYANLIERSLLNMKLAQRMLLLLAILGAGMSVSLLSGWDNRPAILALAAGELITFVVIIVAIAAKPGIHALPRWLVPLAAVAGFAVAGYLAYVELSLSDAVCGLVGNCNAVQQSSYAQFAGIPIGVLGLIGYAAIAAVWFIDKAKRPWAHRALTYMAIFGVVFSAYLTFLEPFVIGASCFWCLTSAVWMLTILWLVVGQDVLAQPIRKFVRK